MFKKPTVTELDKIWRIMYLDLVGFRWFGNELLNLPGDQGTYSSTLFQIEISQQLCFDKKYFLCTWKTAVS